MLSCVGKGAFMTASANTLTLPYADLPARWGVSCERTPAGLSVVVPPVPSWRYLVKSHGWIVIPFGIVLASAIVVRVLRLPTPLANVLWPLALWSVVLPVVAWSAWHRLRTRTVLRVTRDEFIIALVAPTGRCRAMRWPRSQVTDVKINPFSGKLLVRAEGHELTEHLLCPNAEVNEWLADAVRRAVFDGEFAPADPADSGESDLVNAAAEKGHARAALSAVGFCLAAVGAKRVRCRRARRAERAFARPGRQRPADDARV
jgi:hypothetical protein